MSTTMTPHANAVLYELKLRSTVLDILDVALRLGMTKTKTSLTGTKEQWIALQRELLDGEVITIGELQYKYE